MSDMTDERAAEVLAAHNEWRRYNGETGEPGAPAMGDPTELGRAIDHAVSRLRSQPPAEAQPVYGWVNGDAFVERENWTGVVPSTGWVPVYRRPPPSAPVGVEKAARRLLADEYRKRGIGTDLVNDAGTATNVAIAAIATALAQQPAPSAPLGVEVMALIANMAAYLRAEGGENASPLVAHADRLLAQQPAACPATPMDLIAADPTVAYKRGWDDAAQQPAAVDEVCRGTHCCPSCGRCDNCGKPVRECLAAQQQGGGK